MPKNTKRGSISLKLSPTTFTDIKRAAQIDKRAMSAWVRIVVEQELERRRDGGRKGDL